MIETFEKHIAHLEALAIAAFKNASFNEKDDLIASALDGGTSKIFRQTVPLDERRKTGAFFTGSELATIAIENYIGKLKRKTIFIDPACGTGDLLLSSSHCLPTLNTLHETLTAWGEQLIGFDINPLFVRAAKIRLLLAAINRGAKIDKKTIPSLSTIFPYINVGDGRLQPDAIARADYIVINPPYSYDYLSKSECEWASGKVTKAALFMEDCLQKAKDGCKIIAILPDVLRSGARYTKWRDLISQQASIDAVKIVGQFDKWTDIDVFLLYLTATANKIHGQYPCGWWGSAEKLKGNTVGDLFNINVGSVVPYRDSQKGEWHQYIYPKMIKPWGLINHIAEHRRYDGKLVEPPFVVVRRTSRPGDKCRTVGSIINVKQLVAVENHFIVLRAKDSKLETCKKLLSILQAPQTTEWLNERIRCRHLTVSALVDLPWWSL